MNMSKKNVPKKTSNKIFIIFFLAILAVVTLTGFIYYQSQRPNFRDLEAAFNELNIPSDWQQVSESSNRGTWGLFCWQLEGEACPYKINTYTRVPISDYKRMEQLLTSTRSELEGLGYTEAEKVYQKCDEIDLAQNDYQCGVGGVKNGVRLVVSYFSNSDTDSTKGNYVSVSVSKN